MDNPCASPAPSINAGRGSGGNTTIFHIPTDDVLTHPATGHHAVLLEGRPCRVAYDLDVAAWRLVGGEAGDRHLGAPVWRTAAGQWATGTVEQWQARPCLPQQLEPLELAAVPTIAADAAPLPRILHGIWIGDDGLPADLAANHARNAVRGGVYRSMLHVHAQTDAGLARVQAQMAGTTVAVHDVRDDPAFHAFLQSPLGPHYHRLLQPSTYNPGAASDMLRIHLLHEYGGIYLDCDDVIAQPFPEGIDLRAAPADVLLNRWIGAHGLGYFGYGQSCFASQPGNPVLRAMLEEMGRRLDQAGDFLRTPRPWKPDTAARGPGSSPEMDAYILRILHLTGPNMFNDVLEHWRPDYHGIELWLMHAYVQTTHTPSEPRYVAHAYFERMHAALAHYLPFSIAPFEVAIGNADSWNNVRASR